MNTLSGDGCIACRHDSPRVTAAEIAELGREVSGWQLLESDGIARLERAFHFRNFTDALAFTNRVAGTVVVTLIQARHGSLGQLQQRPSNDGGVT